MRRAIVNVGVGYWYGHGSQRLAESLDTIGEPADQLILTSDAPDGWPQDCPPHSEVNYGFKLWALREAQESGYEQAVWIDSSCWAIRPLAELWATLDSTGYYLEPDGANLGEWISDRALEGLGVERAAVWGVPILEGKLMGVDFRSARAREWIDQVERHIGLFNGPWTNEHGEASADPRCRGHRHDIAVGGVIAMQQGMVLHPKLVAFPEEGREPPERAVLLSQGMGTW